MHKDVSTALSGPKPADAHAATPPKPAAESLSDKLHDDLGWAFKKVASVAHTVVADTLGTGTPKDAHAAPAAAAAPKDSSPVAPRDGAPAPPGATREVASLASPQTPLAPPEAAVKPGTQPSDATKPATTTEAAASTSSMFGSLGDGFSSVYAGITSAAQRAEDTFSSAFGSGAAAMQEFSATAMKVADINSLDLNPAALFNSATDEVQLSTEKLFAQNAEKVAGISWTVPGDNKPGGTASVVAKDGHAIASGQNADGVNVKADVTAGKQHVVAGDVTADHTDKNGTTIADKDYKVTKKGDIETVQDIKTHVTTEINTKTHESTVRDPNTGTITKFDANGDVVTQVSSSTEVHQVGDALQEASAASTTPGIADAPGAPVKTKYFQDAHGDMAAVQSDGMVYKYNAKNETLEVGKDGHWVERNFKTGKTSYYTEDPKTHARTEVPAGTMPAGVKVGADGSIAVNGKTVADSTGSTINVGGSNGTDTSRFDTKAKKLTTDGNGGPVTVTSAPDATGTTLNGPKALVVKAPAPGTGGDASVSSAGNPPVTYNAHTGTTSFAKPDGAKVEVASTGAVHMHSVDGQNTDIDGAGNVHAVDKDDRLLFNMNSQGNVALYDGTNLNRDGEVTNAATGLHMYAYRPSPADYSNDGSGSSQDSSQDGSDGSNGSGQYGDDGSGNGYGSSDGSADGTNADGTAGPNGQNNGDATLASGDEDAMSYPTFDALENKVDSALDRLKAKWNFGMSAEDRKEDSVSSREENSELHKWIKSAEHGDFAALPKEWKIHGILQNLDLGELQKGLKDAVQPGLASTGAVSSIESFREKLDDLSLKFGIDTGGVEAQLTGLELKLENKLAATNTLEAAGLAPTAERLKHVQDSGNAPVARAFNSADERISA
jgi:hypothetical protein